MAEDAARFWNEQAADFDDEPDHGLHDPVVRAAWAQLLLARTAQAPDRCSGGSRI
jgi:hypothetical protein